MTGITLNVHHILGSISFEGKRVVSAIDMFAAGGPVPNVDELKAAIARMQQLASAIQAGPAPVAEPQGGAVAEVQAKMTAELTHTPAGN